MFWGSTLFHLDDLPFPVSDLPSVFTQFRRRVESAWTVRDSFPVPETIPSPENFTSEVVRSFGMMPTLEELAKRGGFEVVAPDARSVCSFIGGEQAALQRLQDYFWTGDFLKVLIYPLLNITLRL